MNLRIGENSFRFRITPKDLHSLLQGRELDQRICIGRHCFTYRITPVTSAREMELEMAVAGFCLHVPRDVLDELQGLGRSREGVSIRQGGVDISLQVDVKLQQRAQAA